MRKIHPSQANTLEELEEMGQPHAMRLWLAERGIIQISAEEKREHALWAYAWQRRYEELTTATGGDQ